MTNVIYLMNSASVGIFGMILSASFCDIVWTKRRRFGLVASMFFILLIQAVIYQQTNSDMVRYLYPLITHAPLAVVLSIMNQEWLWPAIAVLTAYLCCQLRRWLALAIVAVFPEIYAGQYMAELLVTLPILLLLIYFVSPSVRMIARDTKTVQFQFGVIPMLGYGFDYLTRIYTDSLSKGTTLAVEFMPFVCSGAYLFFVLRTSKEKKIRSQLEQTQGILNLQVAQAVREIDALRESQKSASTYRHDLRHHMQYLLNCMENDRLEQAENYIHEVCSEIDAYKVQNFCENETANLIFSAFADKAYKQGVSMEIKTQIPTILTISESDLCVLLSNALENALHACMQVQTEGLPATIDVMAYQQKDKFFIQIRNSCVGKVDFVNEIPVTSRAGHGIGVRSICAVVERYGGIYSFRVDGGQFVLRISL